MSVESNDQRRSDLPEGHLEGKPGEGAYRQGKVRVAPKPRVSRMACLSVVLTVGGFGTLFACLRVSGWPARVILAAGVARLAAGTWLSVRARKRIEEDPGLRGLRLVDMSNMFMRVAILIVGFGVFAKWCLPFPAGRPLRQRQRRPFRVKGLLPRRMREGVWCLQDCPL